MGDKSSAATRQDWLAVRAELPARRSALLSVLAFAIPIAIWSVVSYAPVVWHPLVAVTDPGSVAYFQPGMLVERAAFARENEAARARGAAIARGERSNPIYLPAPDEVARALITAFRTPPRLPSEPWLHQSLWQSIQVIGCGFLLSSLFGLPLGILCGTFPALARLQEPFIEFFRYLPAPAFGALAVAVLGIYDAPKVAIIFIGTFFQQVLVVANTTRKLELPLIEAAQTLGASRRQLVFKVVVPGVIVDLYTDMRVLLGWAWTYLIVAEMVGTTSGITHFIHQQARYRNYENVYAAIILIGLIGLGSDVLLARIGRLLFPWRKESRRSALLAVFRAALPARARRGGAPAERLPA
jgi:NitT/TauT family transport system permease protein